MDAAANQFGRRRLIAGTTAGLGLGLAAIAGVSLANAQSTPEASDDATGDTLSTPDDAFVARATERYDEFVAGVAGALSIPDTAAVDTAIRASLTGMVDSRLADGEISANAAETARTAIASSPAPLAGLLMAGRGGFGHGGRGLGGRGTGDRDTDSRRDGDSDEGSGGTTAPESSASPSPDASAATPAVAV